MNGPNDKERTLAAFHEAGHAVARLWRGDPSPPLVEIGGDGAGETHGTGATIRLDPFGVAVVALAGPLAEQRGGGYNEPLASPDCDYAPWQHDLTMVRWVVAEHKVNFEHAVREAGWALDECWPVVAVVADRLIADGLVTGDWVQARAASLAHLSG
jgi:hypothetical protein